MTAPERPDEAPNGEPGFLTEPLTPDFGHFMRAGKCLYRGKSEYQQIAVYDTPQFGRMLRLDNVFQTSVGDEFYYHEMMVHPALMCHPNPQRVLIIGAGDGGMAEEVLKHNTVTRVEMVELDAAVITLAREYLGEIHRGAFDDPRLTVHIQDGWTYVEQAVAEGAQFDVIILDLTDPIGPSRRLYTVDFYQMLRRLLADDGIQVQHVETPIVRRPLYRQLIANLEAVYPEVHPLFQYVPLYGTLWSFCIGSPTLDPRTLSASELDRRTTQRGVGDLQIYNGEVHRAAFAQPNFVRRLLAQPATPIGLDDMDRFDPIVVLGEADPLRADGGGTTA